MSKVFTITEGLENMGALRTGGQGSVYKGKRMGEIITAVKIIPTPIHTENAEDKHFRNFKNEVEKLKKVNEIPNPNVVKILHSGLTESGSFPFIEMEYIEGPDLEDLLKAPHNPLFTIRETIKLAEQLANALAHCHKVGVKHGDIKSNNVKLNTATGNYILFDFGLAIMSDEQRRSSIRHAGAVEFMAPEQHDGEMFFQTDIYSYGVILFELLAGTVPFPQINKGEASRNAVMLSHIEKPLPDLLALRRTHLPADWSEDVKKKEMNVPVWLLNVIKKCLEKAPEKRFDNGMELQEAILHNSTQDFPVVTAVPASTLPPIAAIPAKQLTDDPELVKVSKPIFYVMVLALLALSVFAGYSIYLMDVNKKELAAYTDSLSTVRPDTIPAMVQDEEPDTAVTEIKPIITDSAVLNANTDQDSLQKEFDKQTGAVPVKPATTTTPTPTPAPVVKEKPAGPIISSEGKKYQLPKGTLYFYSEPDPAKDKKGVVGFWTTPFTVVDEQNGFIYVTHTNNDGDVTKGWLKKTDLKELP